MMIKLTIIHKVSVMVNVVLIDITVKKLHFLQNQKVEKNLENIIRVLH